MYFRKLLTNLSLGLVLLTVLSGVTVEGMNGDPPAYTLHPASGETGVNPDTRLEISFQDIPVLATGGKIRIFDASNDSVVDVLDLSIPPGPRNSRTPAPYDRMTYEAEEKYLLENRDSSGRLFVPVPQHDIYQHTYIGGTLESDIYHFYPVLLHGQVATICFHHRSLAYDKTYYVQIDPEVFALKEGDFKGISGKRTWWFSTKKTPPSTEKNVLTVAGDGTGDFNTVLAAIEFIPEKNPARKTIFIKNGRYEEMVYFRNKENISITGEDRDSVMICYANNGVFNPRPTGPREEMIERFRNRRAVFGIDHSNGIHLSNLTIRSLGEKPAQAEGLLVIGERNIVNNVSIIGSGDALQATGTIYISNSRIKGFGDNVLGYGAVFFEACDLISTYGPHMWVRNTRANHGNVFLHCTFSTVGDVETVIARAPSSPDYSFPFVEAVLLHCKMEGIRPEGWGKVAEDTDHIRYWEYNSTSLKDGSRIDVSQRAPYSKQLTMERDSATIARYSDPAYILKGWKPDLTTFHATIRKE